MKLVLQWGKENIVSCLLFICNKNFGNYEIKAIVNVIRNKHFCPTSVSVFGTVIESKINEDLDYGHIHVSIKIEHSTPSWLKLRNFTEAEKLFNMGFILERIKRLQVFSVFHQWPIGFSTWISFIGTTMKCCLPHSNCGTRWRPWEAKGPHQYSSYFCGTYAMNNIKDFLGSCGEVSNRTRELQRANVDFLAS